MNRNLQLPLITKWFEMTKARIKTEDYREITDYWCRRFIEPVEDIDDWHSWYDMISELNDINRKHSNISECLEYYGVKFKKFEFNVMTLGYPKTTNKDRILILEHKGIEIRTGNPDWGAEPNKLYFVIKHGKIIV